MALPPIASKAFLTTRSGRQIGLPAGLLLDTIIRSSGRNQELLFGHPPIAYSARRHRIERLFTKSAKCNERPI